MKKCCCSRKCFVFALSVLLLLLLIGVLLWQFLPLNSSQEPVLGSVTYAPIPEEAQKLHQEYCEKNNLPLDTQFEKDILVDYFAYHSLKELANDRFTIVRGTIVSQNVTLYDTFDERNGSPKIFFDYWVRTETTIFVQEVIKGDLKKGTEFTALQGGGETELIRIDYSDTPTFTIGEEAIFFIDESGWIYPYSPKIQDGKIVQLFTTPENETAFGGKTADIPVAEMTKYLREVTK